MYNPFTDHLKQIEKDQTVTNQQKRSKDPACTLNTITITAPTLSRPLLAQPKFADNYSLSSTKNKPIQTITDFNAFANPSQTLYQPHTAPNTGPSAALPSSSSTAEPTNPSSVTTKAILYLWLT